MISFTLIFLDRPCFIQQPPQGICVLVYRSFQWLIPQCSITSTSWVSQLPRLWPALAQLYCLHSTMLAKGSVFSAQIYSLKSLQPGSLWIFGLFQYNALDAPNSHGSYLIDICAFLIDPENMHHMFLIVQPLTDKAPTIAPLHSIHKVYFIRNQQLLFLLQWIGKNYYRNNYTTFSGRVPRGHQT